MVVEGVLDGLVYGGNGGGGRDVGLREEEGVALHRDERHLDLVVAAHRGLALLVEDVRDRKKSHALGVNVQGHVLLANRNNTRLHRVARVEAPAVALELTVEERGEIHH